MAFVEDDDVIQTLPANAVNDAFGIGILPRAPRCGRAFLHPQTAHAFSKLASINSITIAQRVLRRGPRGSERPSLIHSFSGVRSSTTELYQRWAMNRGRNVSDIDGAGPASTGNNGLVDIQVLMSAFGGKADVRGTTLKSPLIARNGHQRCRPLPNNSTGGA